MKYKSCTEYWLDTEKTRFRGEFEAMYRDIDDPWGCFEKADSLNNRVFCEVLFHQRRFERILDVGCGLGGLTRRFAERGECAVTGCDVSQTAVDKACRLFPDLEFACLNILTDDPGTLGRFDLVVLSEVLWYLLDDLKGVFGKIDQILTAEGILGVHQYFPDNQRFGREIVDGLEGFDAYVRSQTQFAFDRKYVNRCDDGYVLLATMKRKEI